MDQSRYSPDRDLHRSLHEIEGVAARIEEGVELHDPDVVADELTGQLARLDRVLADLMSDDLDLA